MVNYNEKHIQTLKPLEGIRNKLGMYVGSNSNEAVHHIIKEIISNAIDEYLAGFGNKIEVSINKETNSICIKDYGRGIPFGKIEDVFTKLHTSGKFSKEGDAAYGASGGLNGIGVKIATATGKVEVEVSRENKIYKNTFHYEFIGSPSIINSKIQSYTQITWTPDDNVFGDKIIQEDKVLELIQDLSYITPNLSFIFKGKIEKEIKSKNISDFIKDYVAEHDMISPIMSFKKGNSYLMVEGAMVWTKKTNLEQSYVNLVPTIDGGTHCTALKTVLTRELNKFLDSDFKGDEIRKGFTFILSVKTLEEPVFKGQNKDSLNMPTINAPLSALLKDEMNLLFEKNKDFFKDLETVIEKSRKKEAAMNQVREVLAKSRMTHKSNSDKLKPAQNKHGAELFITEGK